MEWSHSIYLKYSKPLISFLARHNITPNQLSIFNIFLMLFGAGWFFSRGTYIDNLIALPIIGLCVIIDYADGDLARARNMLSKAGEFLDSFTDVVLQNGIMGAIAYGSYKNGLAVSWIIIYFVANITLNMVSFHYNHTFGFDSYKGNSLFRQYMDKKPSLVNCTFKNILDPTSSKTALVIFTVRYWIIAGVIFGWLKYCFMIITLITIIRGLFMYVIYVLHLKEYKKLWLLQALAIIDEERREFYAIRQR